MDERRPTVPGAIYGALALAMFAVMGLVTLTVSQPPPPTIAEFAPQAVERIEEAPDEQSSAHGSGEGGTCVDGATGCEAVEPGHPLAPPSPRPVIDVARARRCVGDPPRQIEDPQSPPCVPYWQGDNGGATARGVTPTEIKVEIPTDGNSMALFEAWRTFFNARFEFYGRKMTFFYNQSGIGNADPEAQRSHADVADTEHGVFASSWYRAGGGWHYHDEVARRGIVSVTGLLFGEEGAFLASKRPYLWQYTMEYDVIQRHLGEWACKRLAGDPAAHGGDAVAGRQRAFGIIMQTLYDEDPHSPEHLERALARCGESSRKTIYNGFSNSTGGTNLGGASVDPSEAANVVLQMQEAEVTSVFYLGGLFTLGALQKAATQQNYFPEWIVSSFGSATQTGVVRTGAAPAEQLEHAFGITMEPHEWSLSENPYYWGAREGDPGYSDNGSSVTVNGNDERYRPLLLLASGFQMAGPNLTPETFERGLHRTVFPNPDHENMAGDVGFQGGSYAMTIDAAEVWWSNTTPGPYTDGPGSFCYADGGVRHRLGSWPQGSSTVFTSPCG